MLGLTLSSAGRQSQNLMNTAAALCWAGCAMQDGSAKTFRSELAAARHIVDVYRAAGSGSILLVSTLFCTPYSTIPMSTTALLLLAPMPVFSTMPQATLC